MLTSIRAKLGQLKIALASTSPRRIDMFKIMQIPVQVIPSDYSENIDRTAYTPETFVQLTALGKAIAVFGQHPELDITIAADTMVVAPHDGDATRSAIEILGQPKDKADARATLLRLSGKVHQVLTGVVVLVRSQDRERLRRLHAAVPGARWLDSRASTVAGDKITDLVCEHATKIAAEGGTPRPEQKTDAETNAIQMSFVETTDVTFQPLSEDDVDAYIETGEPFGKAGSYALQGIGGSLIKGINGCHNNVIGFPLSSFCLLFRDVVNALIPEAQ